jgi:protoheme IX farnesyltransferase
MAGALGQYWQLTKPRVIALIVFTAIIGMFLAVPAPGLPGFLPPWRALVFGSLGIWLAAASAAAINHLLDRRIDALMARTAHRPLPTGSLTTGQVLGFAIALGAASMALLVIFVNVLCALLTFASLIGYAIVYTGYLKRATPQNIVIGGAAGAAPAGAGLGGGDAVPLGIRAAAVPDHLRLDAAALLGAGDLPPRGLRARDDPDAAGDPRRGVHALAGAVLHRAAGAGDAAALHRADEFVAVPGRRFVLGGGFLWQRGAHADPPSPMYPMTVFRYSIWYLMALFAFLLFDHWCCRRPDPRAAR